MCEGVGRLWGQGGADCNSGGVAGGTGEGERRCRSVVEGAGDGEEGAWAEARRLGV